jgi:hypothetical protein
VRKALVVLLLCLPVLSAGAWRILYAEEYYKLYHEHLNHYPDDTMEDISYLTAALKAPLANALNALAPIHDKTEYERYQDLFYMHLNLKVIASYIALAVKFQKFNAFFYNYPWKQQNLDSLDKAEQIYKVALEFWQPARDWSAKAWAMRATHLDNIEDWEDENFRIETADLDYSAVINRELIRVAKVRADFQAMTPASY